VGEPSMKQPTQHGESASSGKNHNPHHPRMLDPIPLYINIDDIDILNCNRLFWLRNNSSELALF